MKLLSNYKSGVHFVISLQVSYIEIKDEIKIQVQVIILMKAKKI
jgi:hypothetical protein